MPSRQIRIAVRDVDPHDVPLSPAKPRSRSGGASAPEFHLPSQCHLLRSANADSQTSWRNAGRAAGERRGGCAAVTEPTETAEIANLRVKANEGDADAQCNLGVLYADGQGVPQDYVSAHMWHNLAASQLTGDEQKTAAAGRDALATLMPPAQIAEAQTLSREWFAAFEKRGRQWNLR